MAQGVRAKAGQKSGSAAFWLSCRRTRPAPSLSPPPQEPCELSELYKATHSYPPLGWIGHHDSMNEPQEQVTVELHFPVVTSLYERIMAYKNCNSIPKQSDWAPFIMDVPAAEYAVIAKDTPLYTPMGFEEAAASGRVFISHSPLYYGNSHDNDKVLLEGTYMYVLRAYDNTWIYARPFPTQETP